MAIGSTSLFAQPFTEKKDGFLRGEFMRLKSVLGGFTVAILAFAAAALVFIPTIAQSNQTAGIISGSSVVHLKGGVVTLHLPPGGGNLTGRPADLQITASDVQSGEGVFFGPGLSVHVSLWVPDLNAYVPVASVSDNQNPAFYNWSQQVGRGSPVAQNTIIVSNGTLLVTSKGEIWTINMTKPVNIKFGDPLPAFWKALNFTLPPFTLEFHPIGVAFKTDLVTAVPTSGWTIQSSAIQQPAWTRVWIPAWLGASPIAFDGALNLQSNATYIPPKTP
jgi:hypothetical protein